MEEEQNRPSTSNDTVKVDEKEGDVIGETETKVVQ